MEARIDIAIEENRLMSRLAALGLDNNTNPRNTPNLLAENKPLIHSQTNQQVDESIEATIEKGDGYIERLSLLELRIHS